MKTRATLGAALFLCGTVCWSLPLSIGQSQSTTASDLVPADTPFILVELSDSLNARKLKPGDKIKAQVAQDVLCRGRILIPAESKLVGHVTEAKARQGEDNIESRLGIVFDKVLLKHHEEMNFHGIVHALAPPALRPSAVDAPDPMLPPITSKQNPSLAPLGGSNKSNQPRQNPSTSIPGGPTGTVGGGQPVAPTTIPSGPPIPPASGNNGSLSVGMRQGVFGLKDLSLVTDSAGPSGQVIVSRVRDVKLEYGTQLLLKVTDVPAAR